MKDGLSRRGRWPGHAIMETGNVRKQTETRHGPTMLPWYEAAMMLP